ncbi:MAG: hypothetical protein M1820_001795 [Bogoriella megaspora]|nr:MAG: hypothetical protein M1820_001795 [Bogoriella megaspora]
MQARGLFTFTETQKHASLDKVLDRIFQTYRITRTEYWSFDLYQWRYDLASSFNASHEARFFQILHLKSKDGDKASSTETSRNLQQHSASLTLSQMWDKTQHLTKKMAGHWTLRPVLTLTNGYFYDVGEFRIRVGEVKKGLHKEPRGVVAMIEVLPLVGSNQMASEDESSALANGGVEQDASAFQELIRAFWNGLGITGAKEYFREPKCDPELVHLQEAELWCEALRLKS